MSSSFSSTPVDQGLTVKSGVTERPNPTNKNYATNRNVKFSYDLENAPRNKKLLLLLSSGLAMLGTVTGNAERDSDVWGYFLMPIRDKELELKLGLIKTRDDTE